MKRKTGIYTLWLAGIMFLLHCVVPHHHHESISMDLEHGHAVEHVLHLLQNHEKENEKQSDGHHHGHLITEHVIAVDILKRQQTSVLWHLIAGLPGTSVFVPEPSSLAVDIELWGNATTRTLSPHIIGHGLRAPPSVVC